MKKMKKALLIVLAVVMVAIAAVAGTLAWLHDEGETSVTVNAYGKINLEVTANPLTNEIMIPNKSYDISPAVTIKADSEDCFVRVFVTFNNASQILATMGTKVTLPTSAEDPTTSEVTIFTPHTRVAGWINGPWICADIATAADWAKIYNATANTLTYEFRYANIVTKSDADQPLGELFTTFTLDKYLEEADLAELNGANGLSMTIVAQAMQAVEMNVYTNGNESTPSHFTSADAAWDEYAKQIDPSLR